MTVTLSVNANNDLYLGSDGNIVLAVDITATLQACKQAVRTLLGEMVLATEQGLPYFQNLWGGVPNIQQFEAYIRQAILAVDGVQEIVSLTSEQQGDVFTYEAVILTVYGQGTING